MTTIILFGVTGFIFWALSCVFYNWSTESKTESGMLLAVSFALWLLNIYLAVNTF